LATRIIAYPEVLRGYEKTQVSVRYDPYDMGVAYAYVKNQWVTCISQHYSSLAGHSEKEIIVASEELRKQNKNSTKQFVVTASSLADFLNKSEQQEVVLLQRMQDIEAKEIYSANPVNNNLSKQDHPDEVLRLIINQPEIVEAIPEEIQPYEEFW
jgi:putative transposase